MNQPYLQPVPKTRQTVDVFGGYNRNARISDGEWHDMKNMGSDNYPVLSTRAHRKTFLAFPRQMPLNTELQALIATGEGLCYVVNSCLYLPTGHIFQLTVNETQRQLVQMGAYLIVLPDKKWVNLAHVAQLEGEGKELPVGTHGDIESYFYAPNADYTIKACRADGTGFSNVTEGETAPETLENGTLWLDTSGDYPSLKQWSSAGETWVRVVTNHVRIESTGIGALFEKGDSVMGEFHGISVKNKGALQGIGEMLAGKDPEDYGVFKGTWTIVDKAPQYIIINGNIGTISTGGTGDIHLERRMPDMDMIIECGNRLWGCKYGTTENGFVNEIYASKLGDFKNWHSFQGISTDSYIASVGSDGPFTGAVNYGGRPLFFKENCLIDVYGAFPAQYQIQTTPCQGVQQGCDKSLAAVNNILCYKSRAGVCAYDGSLPTQIGWALGDTCYDSAVAGACGGKYYISMRDSEKNAWNLFVWDMNRGLWHREDDLQVLAFSTYLQTLYCVPGSGEEILQLTNSREPEDFDWMVESGQIGLTEPNSKYVSRLILRLWQKEGGEAAIYAQYDDSGDWQYVCTVAAKKLGSVDISIRPKRCDHIKLRIEGTGDAKIYSITKTIEQGSDVT